MESDKMKTILEWLHEIQDEEVRSKALSNYNEPYVYSHEVLETDSLSTALGKAFFWRQSNEGFMYWFRIHDSICKKENGL